MFDTTERHRAQEALRRSELARHEVLEAMLHSEAAARAQIAGELHDDTIQVMTAALMAVERVTIAAVDTDRGWPTRSRTPAPRCERRSSAPGG